MEFGRYHHLVSFGCARLHVCLASRMFAAGGMGFASRRLRPPLVQVAFVLGRKGSIALATFQMLFLVLTCIGKEPIAGVPAFAAAV